MSTKGPTVDLTTFRTCKVCNHSFTGRFCNKCGEKVTEPEERSLAHFLENLINAFTFLDGKFLKSAQLLITRPGILSRNIADGIRVPYMKMISLFFVANFFYFLFPVFDAYNSSLYTQLNNINPHSARAREIVKSYIKEKNIPMEDFQTEYQNTSTNVSKFLIVLMVLFLTAILAVVNFSRKIYLADHLLFALEYYSFQIFYLVVLSNLFLWIIRLGNKFGGNLSFLLSDNFFTLIGTVVTFWFLVRSQINFYSQKWYWGAIRSIVIMVLLAESVYYYRVSLFYAVMAWMR